MWRFDVVYDPPHADWVPYLRRGHWAWDVKGDHPVQVTWPYEIPSPGTIAGRIGLQLYAYRDGGLLALREVTWFIRDNGTGLNHSLLLLPVITQDGKINLDDQPYARSMPGIEQAIWQLEKRVAQLESLLFAGGYDAWEEEANPR